MSDDTPARPDPNGIKAAAKALYIPFAMSRTDACQVAATAVNAYLAAADGEDERDAVDELATDLDEERSTHDRTLIERDEARVERDQWRTEAHESDEAHARAAAKLDECARLRQAAEAYRIAVRTGAPVLVQEDAKDALALAALSSDRPNSEPQKCEPCKGTGKTAFWGSRGEKAYERCATCGGTGRRADKPQR